MPAQCGNAPKPPLRGNLGCLHAFAFSVDFLKRPGQPSPALSLDPRLRLLPLFSLALFTSATLPSERYMCSARNICAGQVSLQVSAAESVSFILCPSVHRDAAISAFLRGQDIVILREGTCPTWKCFPPEAQLSKRNEANSRKETVSNSWTANYPENQSKCCIFTGKGRKHMCFSRSAAKTNCKFLHGGEGRKQ